MRDEREAARVIGINDRGVTALLADPAGALEGELDIKIIGTSTRAEFPTAS
jgi:hypothetical protein